MNYHILIDDKFTDGFIEDAESVAPMESNRYFIRGDQANALHVKSKKAEWIKDIYSLEFKEILNAISNTDKLFVHWYDLYVGKLMLEIPKHIKLLVPLMGGDFYGEPILQHKGWLFDKRTLRYINSTELYPANWHLRPDLLFRQLKDIRKKKRESSKELLLKKKTVERINYILVDENSSGEVSIVRKLYGIKNLPFLGFNYNQNFDLAKSIHNDFEKADSITRIQVGNSASATNNHVDLFYILKNYLKENIQLDIPLAYGDKNYAGFVKENGTELFQDKINYIENFVTRETYVQNLLEIDICIMFHNRSQALGNCITLLTLGKKLFLKSNNALWELFTTAGIVVFDACKIASMSFAEFKRPLTRAQVEGNITKLEAMFSKEKRQQDLKIVLNN